MRIEITDALWLDEHHEFSLTEFVELSGLSVDELQHLVDCDALLPVVAVNPAAAEMAADLSAAEARFSAQCLTLARAASRLRNDFDLDTNGLTLTLRLLNRIDELEAELLALRAQLPRSAR
ncbi:MAG: chaperone modulator CbpM [Burkholderiales bacterium]